jgi:tRNA-binding protein
MMNMKDEISYADFMKIDIRVGTIIEAKVFKEARNPAYILMIDFGDDIGVKKSSAQITHHYTPEELINKKIMAVVNFPAKQIGPIKSEVLVLGFSDSDNHIVLASPTHKDVPNGAFLH